YDALVKPVYDLTGNTPATSETSPLYTYAWRSIAAVRPNTALCSDCDYQIHLGAFPEGRLINFSISFKNQRDNTIGTISSASYTGDGEIQFTDLTGQIVNKNITGNNLVTATGTFTGSNDNLYYGALTYVVPNNIDGGNWTYKVLVTAESIDDP